MRSSSILLGAMVILLSVAAAGRTADQMMIPKKALDAMAYRVGQWESVSFTDGVEQPPSGHETTQWEPGQFCIKATGSFREDGVEFKASALIGWDGEKKELVEHWFISDGGFATFRYSLDKEPNAWVGTAVWFYGDGRKSEGPSKVEIKTPDEWEWNASATMDGKNRTWRTINKRVVKALQLSNYEKLKGLEFIIGDWEGKSDTGEKTRWTLNWTESKNEIQDISTVNGPRGELHNRAVGVFGWDPGNRRITHWCVTDQGKQVAFAWARQEDGTWETWLPGSKYRDVVSIIDDNTWKMEGSSGSVLFKRVVK